MGEGINESAEILKSKIFPESCMFLEHDVDTLNRKYGFEDVEIFCEEQEGLEFEFVFYAEVEAFALFYLLHVGLVVITIDLP
jgi:hypothetical protein